jgi:hypothetical protein
MRRNFAIAVAVAILAITSSAVSAQKSGTLYSPMKYRNEPRSFCLNFKSGLSPSLAEPCDLRYGLLAINNDFDWLQISTSRESRGVIKDLGASSWKDQFEVPVLTPLARLGPGQPRDVSIDVSGGNGDPGLSPIVASRKRFDGKPKIDPAFVKAIAGHIYAVRVVDEKSDYYALFRIDSLDDGTCNISWRLVQSPKEQDVQ